MADSHAALNEGEENEMAIFGYKSEWWKKALCILFYIISIGLLKLLFYWKPELDVWCHCVPCNLAVADTVLLQTTGEHKYYLKKLVIQVRLKRTMKSGYPNISDGNSVIHKSIMEPEGKVRYIQVQKIRYVLIPSEGKFMKTGVLEESLSCSDIHSKYGFGLSKEEQELRRQICGLNTITVKITPVWTLLTKEVFNPFYVFQLYSFGVWIATQYIEFSLAILLLTIVSISATVYNLRMQSVKLNRMSTSYNSILVSVLHKNGELEEVQSQSLVPGDVIVLSGNKLFLPCDAILISGGCTVNEAMLTGESIPVTKTPLPNIKNSIPWMAHSGEDYKKHVLYCGTEVIQAKRNNQDLVKAVVLQTGFNTAKGDLVRAILYNKPVDIKLHREAIRFLMFLLIFAIFTVAYTVAVLKINGANVHDIVLMSFLAITIAVNPALPASLTFCLLCGQTRLKKLGIFCISPQRINLAGQLNLVCFDKTGTLTEDVLDLYGVLPCEKSRFQDIIFFKPSNNLCWCPILQAMTSCHSLITLDGKLQGDPLDIKMFGGTGWKLEDLKVEMNDDPVDNCTVVKPGPTATEVPVEGIQILQQFPFSSSLQRMSVIAQVIGESNQTVFMKGAPEMVVHFCKPETIPHSFSAKLDDYTVQGFRVLGLAYRSFQKGLSKVSDIDREEVECDLTFLGLLIMENQLKPETTSVLQELSEANIRTVMITGDNLQTAVTVGKKSGMIPSNSNIIMLEACEPENDLPASITWKSLSENQEDENNSKAKSQRYVGERLINNPTTLGNFHFAMNGTSYQVLTQHFSNLLPTVLLNGTIFARMTPKQKSSLIEELQKLDYFVGMCGDGANDCGALKMAHVGISLSELEASVASPFTSTFPSIKCVLSLIKEGRNTLVTSFSLFKFLTVLPIIIMVCMLILFWKQTLLGNYQYLIQDLGINITVFLTMSLNHPSPKLAPYRPSGQLLSPPLLFSVLMQLVFAVIVQTTACLLLQQQPWFNETDVFSACLPLNYSTGNITVREHRYAENFFTTTMFPITTFHQIVAAIVFAKGKPFRQPLYTNYLLSIVITLLTVVGLFLLFADIDTVYTAMELVCTPYNWRVNILIMVIVLLIVSYIAEMWFLENRELWLWIKKLFKYKSKSQYRKMQRRMQKDSEWPPQNKTDYAVQYVSVEDSNIAACSSTHCSATPNIAKYSKQTIITVL
ncbi:probable cation-transporting ATPase 13A4 isoform X2 [Bufo gargarizans]|uniref:probable cation-transporting ATPase 13A4 isoform X2 n=1 Tax=Bufo gargarizans TaxID=30331 RepID=UPI001CF1357B|nr:probable cation-transporting ATPase 13A4 isoform X2 [Bufo gargarizans]